MTSPARGTAIIRHVRLRRIALTVVVCAVVAAVDLATKAVVTHEIALTSRIWLVPGLLALARYDHPMAVSIAEYVKVSCVLPVAIWVEAASIWFIQPRRRAAVAVAAGVGLGGVTGNAAEVIGHHAVTDWIRVALPQNHWVAVNLADLGIMIAGACLLLVVAATLRQALLGQGRWAG